MSGLGLDLGLGLGSGSASFSPASLTLAAWYDPSDLSTMYQTGTRASPGTPVSADGDPVGLILDKSGNQRDFTQGTAANRPLYKTSGGLRWLEFDGTNDGFATAAGQTWDATSDIFFGLQVPSDTQWVTLWDVANAAGEFLGVVNNGAGGSATSSGVGSPSDVVNGTVVNPSDRDLLYDAIGTSARVYECQGASMAFGTLGIGNYGAGFELGGKVYGLIITAANTGRANLRTWLGNKAGISI